VAEIAGEAYQRGVWDAFKVGGFNFTLDHVAQLKVRLRQMEQEKRISWLVDSLSKKRVGRWQEDYEIQALADEGLAASKVIIAKLQEMREHRADYPHTGFALLFRTLTSIGDINTVPVIKSFLNDDNNQVRYYAEQSLGYLEQGWRVVWAVDY